MKRTVRKLVVGKLVLFVGIAVISAMSAGCVRMTEAMLGIDREKIYDDVLAKMGVMNEPPQISTLTAYDTRDPELKIFLSYIGALKSGVEGVAGKDMDAEDFEALLSMTQNDIRKSGLGGSADQNLAMAEKMTDDMRKGTPKYLRQLPEGADQRQSHLLSYPFLYPDPENNGKLDQRATTISVLYKFRTPEEVSQRTRDLSNKLKAVFAGKQGWVAMDLPSGGLLIKYSYKSQYRLQTMVGNTAAIDGFMVNLVPKPGPIDGNYLLYVGFSTGIAEPRKKI